MCTGGDNGLVGLLVLDQAPYPLGTKVLYLPVELSPCSKGGQGEDEAAVIAQQPASQGIEPGTTESVDREESPEPPAPQGDNGLLQLGVSSMSDLCRPAGQVRSRPDRALRVVWSIDPALRVVTSCIYSQPAASRGTVSTQQPTNHDQGKRGRWCANISRKLTDHMLYFVEY